MPVRRLDIDDALAAGIVVGIANQLQSAIATAVANERERCALVAHHLNGWGNKATRQSGLAEHIAKIIRQG